MHSKIFALFNHKKDISRKSFSLRLRLKLNVSLTSPSCLHSGFYKYFVFNTPSYRKKASKFNRLKLRQVDIAREDREEKKGGRELTEQLQQEYQSNMTDLRTIKREILKVSPHSKFKPSLLQTVEPRRSYLWLLHLNIEKNVRAFSFSVDVTALKFEIDLRNHQGFSIICFKNIESI